MNIINISFTGINANRQVAPRGNVSISNNVKVESVEETKLGAGEARQAYKVMFSFKTQYLPNFATIELKGEVLILDSAEEVSKMMVQWNKEKKLEINAARTILNHVMNRCALEVILLSRELGLPSPIPLPSIKSDNNAQAKPEEKADKADKTAAKAKKK